MGTNNAKTGIVVTGASGFIAGSLIHELLNQKCDVLGVARSSVRRLPALQVQSYCETPVGDGLVHLAEQRDRAAVLEAGSDYEIDAINTVRVLIQKGYRKIVYASSATVYGDTASVAFKPTAAVRAMDPYTRVKLTCEDCVLKAGGIVARLSNVYGPGMAPNNVISKILGQIPGKKPVRIWDRAHVRDFLWIQDAALAVAALVRSDCCGIYNVGTGIGTSVGKLAELLLAQTGQGDRDIVSTHPSGEGSCNVLDIEKTSAHLNWTPKTSLEEGLRILLRQRQIEEVSYAKKDRSGIYR